MSATICRHKRPTDICGLYNPITKMTDTPETDAAYKNHAWDMHDHIPIEFSRKLERERDAAGRMQQAKNSHGQIMLI